jgi:hypothetical protein
MSGIIRNMSPSAVRTTEITNHNDKGENAMSELNVRIVKLEPMRVASVQGFGAGPEHQAWAKLQAWAERKGYIADLKSHRFFGSNNPEPSSGSPNYGYEQWMTVTLEVEPGRRAHQDLPRRPVRGDELQAGKDH